MASNNVNPASNLRCRPGDLALVFRSPQPAKVGRIVRVLRRPRRGECWELRGTWLCESLSGPFLNVYVWADGSEPEHRLEMTAAISDGNLKPLRPGDEPEVLTEIDASAADGGAA